jgi:hypothetical protein
LWSANLKENIPVDPRCSTKKIFRRIFGSESERLTGKWRQYYNLELHNFKSWKIYFGDQISEGVFGGMCSMHGRGEESITKN